MAGRWAGSGVGKYNNESPKQGSKRFNSITIHFAHLGIIFIYGFMGQIYVLYAHKSQILVEKVASAPAVTGSGLMPRVLFG